MHMPFWKVFVFDKMLKIHSRRKNGLKINNVPLLAFTGARLFHVRMVYAVEISTPMVQRSIQELLSVIINSIETSTNPIW